ncbi:hypothetical protein M0R45_002878 [Rubus argutus]|uniref:Uncharacterized protein n=1 Tax=Rubus argutus TaxID=59490 RepID=A0AAW1VM39_RUBAR
MAASTATVRASGWTACAAWADRRGEQQREKRPGIVAEQQRWVIGTADLVQRWIEHKLEGEGDEITPPAEAKYGAGFNDGVVGGRHRSGFVASRTPWVPKDDGDEAEGTAMGA